jgi:hypothetical protein
MARATQLLPLRPPPKIHKVTRTCIKDTDGLCLYKGLGVITQGIYNPSMTTPLVGVTKIIDVTVWMPVTTHHTRQTLSRVSSTKRLSTLKILDPAPSQINAHTEAGDLAIWAPHRRGFEGGGVGLGAPVVSYPPRGILPGVDPSSSTWDGCRMGSKQLNDCPTTSNRQG